MTRRTEHRNQTSLFALLFLSTFYLVLGSPNSQTKVRNVLENGDVVNNAMLGRIGASIMAESALIDKETARIYWEGGSTNTLSSSVNPYLTQGLRHVKASILSCFLLIMILSAFSNWIRGRIDPSREARPLPATVVLFLAEWTILKVPTFDRWFTFTILALYLLEAYFCKTHTYLNNAISGGSVEDYIESLREHLPEVTWKVRSFHFERRPWVSPFFFMAHVWKNISQSNQDEQPLLSTSPSLFTKKVITNKSTKLYEFTNCLDSTTAGVWKRAESTRSPTAPFTKIILTKLLVLADANARKDYFQQQAAFVTEYGQGDEYAEFSTSISVEGFKPRVLAVRDVEGVPSAKLFRRNLFWFFTLLGLTVPYRIWFARHCDELRVTVVKETSCEKKPSSSWTKSWFTSKSEEISNSETFKRRMQELALYKTKADDINAERAEDTQILMDNIEAANMAAHLPKVVEQIDNVVDDAIEKKTSSMESTTSRASGWFSRKAEQEDPEGTSERDPESGSAGADDTSDTPIASSEVLQNTNNAVQTAENSSTSRTLSWFNRKAESNNGRDSEPDTGNETSDNNFTKITNQTKVVESTGERLQSEDETTYDN